MSGRCRNGADYVANKALFDERDEALNERGRLKLNDRVLTSDIIEPMLGAEFRGIR